MLFDRHFRNQVLSDLDFIKKRIIQMATRSDLQSAISALQAAEATRDAAVTKAITDLQAKIAAGQVTTVEDFSPEIANLLQLQTNAASLTQAATADDPGATDVTAPAPAAGATGTAAPAAS